MTSRNEVLALAAAGLGGGAEPVEVVELGGGTYNEVYREFFQEPYPARTTVGASLPSGILVEIEAIARRPG